MHCVIYRGTEDQLAKQITSHEITITDHLLQILACAKQEDSLTWNLKKQRDYSGRTKSSATLE